MDAARQLTMKSVTKAAGRWCAVLELANRQHGVVALEQLVGLGISAPTVRAWVARGRLERLHRGVFVVGHRALRPQGHWLAAVFACGPGSLLSHASAAVLHDVRGTAATLVDVTVPGRIGRSRTGLRVHSGDVVGADERTEIDGIPCTSLERTILDLAPSIGRRGVERVCEHAHRRGNFDPFALRALRLRHRGRRGVRVLDRVLVDWDQDLGRVNSELEALLLRAILSAGMDRPIVNAPINVAGRSFEVDFQWPAARLIVETDGAAFHDNPLARRRDEERDRLLAAAGWTVIRLRWADVTERRTRTLARLQALLDASLAS